MNSSKKLISEKIRFQQIILGERGLEGWCLIWKTPEGVNQLNYKALDLFKRLSMTNISLYNTKQTTKNHKI